MPEFSSEMIWLEVETDDGLVGLGELFGGAPTVDDRRGFNATPINL